MALLSLPLGTLGAVQGITATYKQEDSLQFGAGESPYTPEHFVALLGEMTVTIDNPPVTLKQASIINVNSSSEFLFWGRRWYNGYQTKNTGFYLDTVSYINGDPNSAHRSRINQQVVKITNPETKSNIYSMVVKFYFVAYEQNINSFVPYDTYSLSSGTIGTFNFAVSPTEPPSTNINWKKDYISINGQTVGDINEEPSTPIPIIGSGPTTTLPDSIPYVDAEHPLPDYQFFIVNETPISLPNAYGPLKTKVADARVSMLHGQSGETYKIHVNFTSINAQPDKFYLYLDGNHNLYGIPYDLDFDGIPVVPGADIPWEGIPSIGPVERSINVTGINKQNAESAPSGTYQDSIYVNVTSDF